MAKPNFGVTFGTTPSAAPTGGGGFSAGGSGFVGDSSGGFAGGGGGFVGDNSTTAPAVLPGAVSQSGGGGGGLLHGIEHFGGKFLTNLEDAAINFPAGVVQLVTNPVSTLEAMPGQIYQDFRHPGRNPGNTFLDALMVGGGITGIAGRLGEIGSIAARGGALPAELTDLNTATALGRRAQFNNIIDPTTLRTETIGEDARIGKLRQYSGGGRTEPETASFLGKADQLQEALPTREVYDTKSVNRQILHALLHGPAPEERLLRTADGEIVQPGWNYSKNPGIKALQKKIDLAYEANPDASLANRLAHPYRLRTQEKRIQSAIIAEQTVQQGLTRDAAAQLLKKWGKADNAFQLAGRMVAEGTTPEELTRMHQTMIRQGSVLGPRMIAETNRRIEMIKEASQYLDKKTITSEDGLKEATVPVVKPEHADLQNYVDDMRRVSKAREGVSKVFNVLSHESAYRRIMGPKNFAVYGRIPPNIGTLEKALQTALKRAKNKETPAVTAARRALAEAHGQLSFEDLANENTPGWIHGDWAEELANKANLFRVPYEVEQAPRLGFGPGAFRSAYMGRKVATPESYMHEFEGGVLKHGGGELNAAKLMASSYMETQRFVALKNARARILAASQLTPEKIPEQYRQIIRTDEEVPGAMNYKSATEEALMGKPLINPQETELGGLLYEGIRQGMFPDKARVIEELRNMGGGLKEKFFGQGGQGFQPVPGYRWVDSRMLGNLNKRDPLFGAMESPVVRRGMKIADTINNAEKFAVLYLKPAYALPNMIGNLFLNFTQQGFLAPWNLAKSSLLLHRLDPVTIQSIRSAMGGGFTEGLKSVGVSGKVFKLTRAASNAYGKVVDEPFRFSSFLHEAKLQGFSTPAELKALTHDERFAPDLEKITNRAGEEILNYERMSPAEQSVLRRLVFFYPWLKASSRYANYFLKNHPVAAGVQGQLAQQGGARIERMLGSVPSFMEGAIPFTGGDTPLVGNPASISILQQPADLLKMVQALGQSGGGSGLEAASQLAPFDAAALAGITLGKASSLPHKAGEPTTRVMLDELVGGLPLRNYISNAIGGDQRSGILGTLFGPAPRPSSVYPNTSELLNNARFWGWGNAGPRAINLGKANYDAYLENNPRGFVGG